MSRFIWEQRCFIWVKFYICKRTHAKRRTHAHYKTDMRVSKPKTSTLALSCKLTEALFSVTKSKKQPKKRYQDNKNKNKKKHNH